MRIGLLGPRRNTSFGGSATFEQELFEGLVAAVREQIHTLVVFSQFPRPVGLPNYDRIEWVRVGSIVWGNLAANVRRLINSCFNNLFHLPSPFRNEHWIDAYLHDSGVELFLNLIPETIPTEVPYMMFIWDLMHRTLPFFPECSQRGAWVRREARFGRMIQRAAILGVGTETGKQEAMRFYQVPESRIHVLPFPTPRFALEVGLGLTPAQTLIAATIGDEYVFYPANFHAHKNHVTLLHAIAILRDHHGVLLHAAFSGRDWGNLAHVKELVRRLGLERQIHFMGFVSREELVGLYRSALALVFPSLLGPDNIPPLEAFGLGCPAIVADIPGASEQMQGAALLFTPTDEHALAEAILMVRRDHEFRDNLIARGKVRARQFNSRDLGVATLGLIGEFEAIRRCWPSGKHYPSRYNVAGLFGG